MPDSEPTDDNNNAHRVELRIVARADKKDVERHKTDDDATHFRETRPEAGVHVTQYFELAF